MKRKILCLGLLFLVFDKYIFCGQTSDQINELHRKISEGLIKIRRENPKIQSEVYTLLDQVGKLSRYSNIAVQKKKRMKRASIEEREMRFAMKVENEKLLASLADAKEELRAQKQDASESRKRLNAMSREKSNLIQRNQEIEAKEREYRARLRAVESSLKNPNSLPANSPDRLSKAPETKKESIIEKEPKDLTT